MKWRGTLHGYSSICTRMSANVPRHICVWAALDSHSWESSKTPYEVEISDKTHHNVSADKVTCTVCMSTPWIWEGASATLQNGRCTFSYKRRRGTYTSGQWEQLHPDSSILISLWSYHLISRPILLFFAPFCLWLKSHFSHLRQLFFH